MHASSTSDAFARFSPIDVRDLLAEHPLAWVMSGSVSPTLLPLLAETADDGRVTRLIGHLARRNPLTEALRHDPTARILVNGPQAYVAAEHAATPGWVPTWNYAQLAIEATVVFEPDATDDALRLLTNAMEAGREPSFRVTDAGDRYAGMAAQVIAFRADIVALTGRFKLGQDEKPVVLRRILAHHPDAGLTRWMRRMNAARL